MSPVKGGEGHYGRRLTLFGTIRRGCLTRRLEAGAEMADWEIYTGSRTPHNGIETLPRLRRGAGSLASRPCQSLTMVLATCMRP